jgi:hypothetical protein
MPDIDIPLTEEILNKNIQKMLYLPDSLKVFIWCDNKPIVVDVDLKSMTRTAENLVNVFDGTVDDETRQNLILIMSNGLAPYMLKYAQNGNGNDNTEDGLTDEYADALDSANNKTIPKFEENELSEIPNKDYSEFIINTIKKEVKRDDVLVRQVLYTAMSAYTFDPINLGIISPTSEGKTYGTMKVVQYFPNEDVWNIGGMSTMALVRQKGITINSKGESIEEKIEELKREIQNTTTTTIKFEPYKPEDYENNDTHVDEDGENHEPTIAERVKMKKEKIRKELDNLLEDASKLINLQGKILIFLEPPHHELWTILKPILSHDTIEISYPYVEKNDRGQFITRNVVVRGWPACIFCSAKDESQWKIWPEIQSRFLITSPNMNKEKVHDGNLLIAQRKGLPNSMQQQIIVSDKELELARKAVSFLRSWITKLFMTNGTDYNHANAVWIPYGEILSSRLSGNKGTDNRATNRIFSLLNIIPLINVNHRPNLIYGNERLVIATLEDLSETLHITQNMSGIPTHKVKFYTDIFTKLYESKTEPDSKDDRVEDIIAVTTSQLCEFYKSETGKSISTKNLHNQFINELLNNGFIDERDSLTDKRQKIYFPIMEMPIKDESDNKKIRNYGNMDSLSNFLQHNKIKVSEICKKIHLNWLKLEILRLQKYVISQQHRGTFQLIDKNDDETCVCQFIKNYELSSKLINYFSEPKY